MRPAELTLEALDDQRWLYAALTLETSAVLRRAVSEDGLNPWEYFRDGEYPAARAEKDEIERLVERLLAMVDQDTLAVLWEEQRDWLQAQTGRPVDGPKERERLLAFWMLHLALEQAGDRRRQDSLAPPRATDPVFANEPELLNAMHDGLLPLDDRAIPPGWFGSDNVLRWGEHALFPHPYLAPMRELVAALIELAVEGSARVYIAIDPLRRIPLSNVKPRLLLDQWTGITLTPRILDSLDSKDIQDSFHRAVGRDPSEQRVLPLLGTWFRWRRRDDKGSFDPVRRLYIEEVVAPAASQLPAISFARARCTPNATQQPTRLRTSTARSVRSTRSRTRRASRHRWPNSDTPTELASYGASMARSRTRSGVSLSGCSSATTS